MTKPIPLRLFSFLFFYSSNITHKLFSQFNSACTTFNPALQYHNQKRPFKEHSDQRVIFIKHSSPLNTNAHSVFTTILFKAYSNILYGGQPLLNP